MCILQIDNLPSCELTTLIRSSIPLTANSKNLSKHAQIIAKKFSKEQKIRLADGASFSDVYVDTERNEYIQAHSKTSLIDLVNRDNKVFKLEMASENSTRISKISNPCTGVEFQNVLTSNTIIFIKQVMDCCCLILKSLKQFSKRPTSTHLKSSFILASKSGDRTSAISFITPDFVLCHTTAKNL